MPIYEYVCPGCSHKFELKQSMKDEAVAACGALWHIRQPDHFLAGDHVQRQRMVCDGLLGQNETAGRRVVFDSSGH